MQFFLIAGHPDTDYNWAGDHCYSITNLINGLVNQVAKDDRDMLYDPTINHDNEFNKGVIHHYVQHIDIWKAWSEYYDNGYSVHEKLLRIEEPSSKHQVTCLG